MPSAPRSVLDCQPLENRETPAGLAETFDTSLYPFAPAGWQEWASNGSQYYGITRDHAVSGRQSVALYGTLGVQSRLWTTTENPGDVSLQAYVYSDNPAPVLLFARGSDLDTPAASYVGVTVGPAGSLAVVESVAGAERVVASLPMIEPIATTWLSVNVKLNGGRVTVQVEGANTQEFLSPGGTWQTEGATALSADVSLQPASGQAGIGRESGPYGTGYLDDFRVDWLDATAVVVSPVVPPPTTVPPVVPQPVETPSDPVVVSPPPVVVDPVPESPPASPPPVEVPPVVVPPPVVVSPPIVPPPVELPPVVPPPVVVPPTVPPLVPPPVSPPPASTPPASPPTPVQHYSHIRIAQLAYDGTPIGSDEQDLAANSVDLIVPNPKYFDTFEQLAPDAQKFVYTNVSNLYQDLLADWLTYADAQGIDREAAFYHVAQATPFSGNSSSSLPVNWFWGVTRGGTDLTWQARGSRTDGVSFGGTGEAVTLTYPDRFREINVALKTPARPGWSGEWEYVSAVDAAGNPTAWKALPLVYDGTNTMTADGRIAFDPPADWVASNGSGAAGRLYAIRFNVTAGPADQAPVAKSILGRDYVNANGTINGTIPAFDAKADANGDGYLTDAEYANRRAGFDARFESESRLFYPSYGQMRYATDPTPAVQAWAGQYYPKLLATYPAADGFFLDNANGRSPVGSTAVLEPTVGYPAQMAAVVQAMRDGMPGRVILANTTGGFADANGVTQAAGASLEEFLLRPDDANWSQVGDAANVVKARLAAAGDSAEIVLDARPGSAANMTDPRSELGALSYYYLLADPVKTYFLLWGGYAPAADWSKKWVAAAAVDVGQPQGAMTVFAQGQDPQNGKLTYKVYGREYGNALVLFKPKSYALGQGSGTTADATATTHQLDGNYRQLNADGTLGPVIQSITLRNGEGAVLMKA